MSKGKIITKVLVVDDDDSQRLLLKMSLEEDLYEIVEAANGIEALAHIAKDPSIRLVLTDLIMPEMDGFDLIRRIREEQLHYIYTIVLTSQDNKEALLKALSLGADDFLNKPIMVEELKLRLRGGIRLVTMEGQEELLLAMAKMADYRSEETGFHLERVSYYTRVLGKDLAANHPELGISFHMAEEISKVSPLHDIGKIAIPDSILHKPGRLTPEEFEIMKTHTTVGGNLIRDIYIKTGSPYFRFAQDIVMYHHERWDGRGYPEGLMRNVTPLCARIMALADVYDAMTTKRCYKDAAPHQEVKEIILQERGQHFDPAVVDAFVRQENVFLAIKERFDD